MFNVPARIALNPQQLANDIHETAQASLSTAQKYKLFAVMRSLVKSPQTSATTSSLYSEDPLIDAVKALRSFVENEFLAPLSAQQIELLAKQERLNDFFRNGFGNLLTDAKANNVREFIAALTAEKPAAPSNTSGVLSATD